MKIIFAGLLTLCSGFLTGYFFIKSFTLHLENVGMYLMPGILFGIAVSGYLLLTEKISFKDSIKLIFYSVIAWVAAYSMGALTAGVLIYGSGVIGAWILAKGIQHIVPKLQSISPIVVAGGISAIPFKYFFTEPIMQSSNFSDPKKLFFVCLSFICWQMTVGITLAVMLVYKNKITNDMNVTLSPNIMNDIS